MNCVIKQSAALAVVAAAVDWPVGIVERVVSTGLTLDEDVQLQSHVQAVPSVVMIALKRAMSANSVAPDSRQYTSVSSPVGTCPGDALFRPSVACRLMRTD